MSAINLKLQYGSLATMPSTITNGTLNVATDVEKAFVDVNGIRVALGDVVTLYTEAQIKAIVKANALPKLYMASDTFLLFYFDPNGGEEEAGVKPGAWVQVGGSVSRAEFAEKDASGNVITTTYETKTDAQSKFDQLSALIAAINSFEISIINDISAAPVPGSSNYIYFVPNNPIATNPDYNTYDEYIWVGGSENGHYEKIGTTETDLTNYYTKTESDATETAIYAALGFTKAEATAQGFQTVDARLDALEGSSSTDGGRITELEAKFGTFNDSTAQGFQTVEQRFTAAEGRITTAEGDIDALEGRADALETEVGAATNPDAASLRGRMATAESDIDNAEAAIGTYNIDTTSTGYKGTISDRLDTLENDTADADAVAEINAKLGNYLDSTAQGFVSVEDRFTAVEGRATAVEGRATALETEVGAATNPDASSLRGRMATAEGDIDNAEAAIGAYNIDTTSADYKGTISARLDAIEADTTDADAIDTLEGRVDALETEVGDATNPATTSLRGRMATAEGDIDALEGRATALETEVGDATNPAAGSLRGRMATAESDIDALEGRMDTAESDIDALEGRMDTAESDIDTAQDDITELKAKIGVDYPDSTTTGFKSVKTRLDELVTSIGNINRFNIRVVETLPATGELYTIYFVPIAVGGDDNNDTTKYTEWMWIADDSAAGGYFEKIGITEADLSEYYTSAQVDAIIGTNDTTAGTLRYRIKSNEDAIAALQTEVGAATNPATTSLRGRMATAESDIDALEGRMDTAEADITEINAKLGTMAASTAQGFVSVEDRLLAIEGGAVAQTEDDDDAEKPVLVSGSNDHDTVEYVANVTVNAETGGVTANQITLGAATLTFDTVTGALVVNY